MRRARSEVLRGKVKERERWEKKVQDEMMMMFITICAGD